jgi:carbonic anhydrase/acetyltransferase-like protein (isoleucine patch superfamily)
VPFQPAIVPGKFPKQVTHFVYGPRRLYGLCWCAVFYFTPLYYAFLSVPGLRKLMLRVFGDAWLRDLPMLRFSEGVYTANKCTIGSNLCLANGFIMVDYVTLGKDTTVGHLAVVALGTVTGEKTEIGIGTAVGIRARLGSKVRIAPTVAINHGAELGDGVEVGAMSYIGLKARIASGLKVPSGCSIPEGADVKTQDDLRRFVSSETDMLARERDKLADVYALRATTDGAPAEGMGSHPQSPFVKAGQE